MGTNEDTTSISHDRYKVSSKTLFYMKSILITFALMAAHLCLAQVNMELFKRDQVWLFAGKTYEGAHGIVLTKGSKVYQYDNHNHKPKALEDILSIFFGDFKIDTKRKLFYFTRCNYAYRIITINDTDLILEREPKRFTKDFDDFESRFPKRFAFKRLKKKVNLTIYEYENGDGDVMPVLGKLKIN